MSYNPLTDEERRILIDKGTERPFTGAYDDHFVPGTFICRQCNAPLFSAADKFRSGCGWPSFDDDRFGNVRRTPDPDGRRTEILCDHCGGHLGHVFHGEHLTEKDTRHCVNSLSIRFIPEGDDLPPILEP